MFIQFIPGGLYHASSHLTATCQETWLKRVVDVLVLELRHLLAVLGNALVSVVGVHRGYHGGRLPGLPDRPVVWQGRGHGGDVARLGRPRRLRGAGADGRGVLQRVGPDAADLVHLR